MRLPTSKSQEKALIAIALAGGLLCSPGVVLREFTEANGTLITRILKTPNLSPEGRAYYLIALANDVLNGNNVSNSIEAANELMEPKWVFDEGRPERTGFLAHWVRAIARGRGTGKPTSFNAQDADFASRLLSGAVKSLELSKNSMCASYFHFAAAVLYRRLGDFEAADRCEAYCEKVIHQCETDFTVDEAAIKSSTELLWAQADQLAFVEISDMPMDQAESFSIAHVSEIEFTRSEKIRLRAVTLADRLPTSNHLRRKTHRDLALWYRGLDKNALANTEKAKLFDLVGIRDDSILYPQAVGCGWLNWWNLARPAVSRGLFCGMG